MSEIKRIGIDTSKAVFDPPSLSWTPGGKV
jgi:hypothetical protein